MRLDHLLSKETSEKRLSRREQRGWTGARTRNQESEDSVWSPRRREAERREQAKRDS